MCTQGDLNGETVLLSLLRDLRREEVVVAVNQLLKTRFPEFAPLFGVDGSPRYQVAAQAMLFAEGLDVHAIAMNVQSETCGTESSLAVGRASLGRKVALDGWMKRGQVSLLRVPSRRINGRVRHVAQKGIRLKIRERERRVSRDEEQVERCIADGFYGSKTPQHLALARCLLVFECVVSISQH